MIKITTIILAAALLTACSEPTPPIPSIQTIHVTASAEDLFAGDSLEVRATAMSTDGSPFPLRTVVWSTSNVEIATVTATGPTTAEVRTIGAGVVAIKATVESYSGQIALIVTDTTTPPEMTATPMAPIMRGQIAFLDPWEEGIFVADSTGRRLQRVSQTSGALDLAVSPDGKNIAFSKYCDSLSQSCSQLYVMTVDRTDPLLLQTGDTRDQPAHPTWSPDGKRIAFVQQGFGSTASQIFSIHADGTGVTQLTHSGYNGYPEWSPDGSRILLTRSEDVPPDTVRYGIFEMDPDGSNLHQLRRGFRDSWPTWSPDGSRIAFIDLNPEGYVFSLVVMNADGSGATALKSSPDWTTASRPAWSPDGKTVTFIVRSSSRMCEDIWDYGMVPCGQSAKRVGIDGRIDPSWELPSASNLVWQR